MFVCRPYLFCLAVSAVASTMCSASVMATDVVKHDFRNLTGIPDEFDRIGSPETATLNTNGYEVRIDNTSTGLVSGGLSRRVKSIPGDFEVSLEYAIRELVPPSSGAGSGPKIYMHLGSPRRSDTGAIITLAYFITPDGGAKYVAIVNPTNSENRFYQEFDAPLLTKGSLSVRRTARLLIFLVTDNGSGRRELARLPVTTEPLSYLGLLNTVSGPGKSDVSFESVSFTRNRVTVATGPQLIVAGVLSAAFAIVLVWSFRQIHIDSINEELMP